MSNADYQRAFRARQRERVARMRAALEEVARELAGSTTQKGQRLYVIVDEALGDWDASGKNSSKKEVDDG